MASPFSARMPPWVLDQELGVEQARGIPAHAGVLRQAEEVSGGLGEQHLGRERQDSSRSGRMRHHAKEARVVRLKYRTEGNVFDGEVLSAVHCSGRGPTSD